MAARLGMPSPVCTDLYNACAGSCTALTCGDQVLRAGAAWNAVVIGAAKVSDLVDWTDRSTCLLLGDGAGVAVVSRTEREAAGIGAVARSPSLRADRRCHWWTRGTSGSPQEGQTVFRPATSELPAAAREACLRAVPPSGPAL